MPTIATSNQPNVDRSRVSRAIASAAARSNVDFKYLMNQARVESGLDPMAQASTSSATGLFQFTRQTWLGTLKAHGSEQGLGWAADAIKGNRDGGYRISDPALQDDIMNLRYNPEVSSSMAAALASDHADQLSNRLGRDLEPVDLYLAHFLGVAGATSFLTAYEENPDAAAAPLLPDAAAANRAVFFAPDGRQRTLAEIRNNFAARLGSDTPLQNMAPRLGTGTNLTSVGRPWSSNDGGQDADRHNWSDQMGFALPSLRQMDPMPSRLSLNFARSAYMRLASMSGEGDA